MAIPFPYTFLTGQLPQFLEKVQDIGVPNVADMKWLKSIGYSSLKAGGMLTILKSIGFTDGSGHPNEKWRSYRDKSKAKKVLGEGVREAYGDLFTTFPDASSRSDEDLRNYFSSNSDASPDIVTKIISTFRTLASQSDLSESKSNAIADKETTPSTDIPLDTVVDQLHVKNSVGSGVTININIQLALPESTDEKVYDNFFSAMKKYLLS